MIRTGITRVGWRGGAVMAVLAMTAVAGCSGSDSSSSSDAMSATTGGTPPTFAAATATTAAAAADTTAAADPAVGAGGGGDATASGEPTAVPNFRAIISTAALTLTVDDVPGAAAKVADAALAAGGYVASSEQQVAKTKDDRPSATVTIKVPPGDFNRLLDSLGSIGSVRERKIDTQDVTDQFVDLDARVGAMKASTQRLIDLMGQSNNVGEIASIEAELTRRTSDLEALEGQLQVLKSQVSLSTITVVLQPTPVVAPEPPPPVAVDVVERAPSFLDGLRAGWHALVVTARVVALVGGAALPWLVPGSVVLAFVVVVRRRLRRSGGRPAPSVA